MFLVPLRMLFDSLREAVLRLLHELRLDISSLYFHYDKLYFDFD